MSMHQSINLSIYINLSVYQSTNGVGDFRRGQVGHNPEPELCLRRARQGRQQRADRDHQGDLSSPHARGEIRRRM